MSDIQDVRSGPLANVLATRNYTKSGLGINAGGAATLKTLVAASYSVDGVLYSKAALAAQSFAPTHNAFGGLAGAYVQPANTTAYYTVGVNAAGTVAIVQGSYAGQVYAADATAGLGSMQNGGAQLVGDGSVPALPAGYAPLGIVKIATTAAFTPGTTLLDAGTVTATYFDVSILPSTKV